MRHSRRITACCHANDRAQLNTIAAEVSCAFSTNLFRIHVTGDSFDGYMLHGVAFVIPIRTLRDTYIDEGFEIIYSGLPSEGQVLAFYEDMKAPEAHSIDEILEAWNLQRAE